mmetsp:Transcript_56787/g.162973  ORF Transcript_56787/g.162973 Transcript_56787/m.162973 type:complete len:202 (-) Transcript_56787:214-819(-)
MKMLPQRSLPWCPCQRPTRSVHNGSSKLCRCDANESTAASTSGAWRSSQHTSPAWSSATRAMPFTVGRSNADKKAASCTDQQLGASGMDACQISTLGKQHSTDADANCARWRPNTAWRSAIGTSSPNLALCSRHASKAMLGACKDKEAGTTTASNSCKSCGTSTRPVCSEVRLKATTLVTAMKAQRASPWAHSQRTTPSSR